MSTPRRTDLGTIFVSPKRLCEGVRGPLVCLFPDSTFSPPPVHSEKSEEKVDRGGGLISAERKKSKGGNWGNPSTLLSSPCRPPKRWGKDRKHFSNWDKETQIKGIKFALRGSTAISISSKIWPIMSWSPARLQPRGPSFPLQLSQYLQVMEMVNTLHMSFA